MPTVILKSVTGSQFSPPVGGLPEPAADGAEVGLLGPSPPRRVTAMERPPRSGPMLRQRYPARRAESSRKGAARTARPPPTRLARLRPPEPRGERRWGARIVKAMIAEAEETRALQHGNGSSLSGAAVNGESYGAQALSARGESERRGRFLRPSPREAEVRESCTSSGGLHLLQSRRRGWTGGAILQDSFNTKQTPSTGGMKCLKDVSGPRPSQEE